MRFGLPVRDHSVYAMRGKFQKQMTHQLAKEDDALAAILRKKDIIQSGSGPRLSLTFRYNGEEQPDEEKTSLETVWDNEQGSSLAIGVVNGPNFAQVYAEVAHLLVPDVTKMMGKVYTNGGRLCATFTHEQLIKVYRYGGSGKVVHQLGQSGSILECLGVVAAATGKAYNWVHVVYYPDGQCKLNAHADDESSIATNSTIAGISLYANKDDFRCMEFARKKQKKAGPAPGQTMRKRKRE